jgi:hypothetical protein
MKSPELERRAKQYQSDQGIQLDFNEPLGEGTDGIVLASSRHSAVKALQEQKNYLRELKAYQRLMEHGIGSIDGLTVPALIHHDPALLIIEIDIVEPPYLLDFGKAYIDEDCPYSQEELAEYYASLSGYFRRADLPRVRKVCRILQGYGITYLDAKPQNIRLHTDEEERNLPDDDDCGDDLPDESSIQ